MRDPFEELGAQAHRAASAPVSPEVHGDGRQRLIDAAGKLAAPRQRWHKAALVPALAVAAAIALVWGSLALCTALLAAPAYLPVFAHVLRLAPPDRGMWTVILGMSLAPLLIGQVAALVSRRHGPGSPR